MNTSKLFRSIGMKYTHYLVFGNFFVNRLTYPSKNYLIGLITVFDLIRTFILLGLGSLLLPFAMIIDIGRLYIYYQIRVSRKLKQISFIYNFRKSTANLVYRSSRLAFLFIQKTDTLKP